MSITNSDLDCNSVPVVHLEDTFSQLEVLKHMLITSLDHFTQQSNKEQASLIRLNLLLQEKEEYLKKLENTRLERDTAIGERFLLHTNAQEHSAYKELIHNGQDLQAKLIQCKLQQVQIKSNIQTCKEELDVMIDSILTKKACILCHHKEYEKIANQRDLINEKLLRGERLNEFLSKPPLSTRSSILTRFISKLYSASPVSNTNKQQMSPELKINNV